MEKMSAKEREMLKSLQAKFKRVQRAEAEFFQEADARKEELLQRWGIQLSEPLQMHLRDEEVIIPSLDDDSEIITEE